jgi:hypothetical protein
MLQMLRWQQSGSAHLPAPAAGVSDATARTNSSTRATFILPAIAHTQASSCPALFYLTQGRGYQALRVRTHTMLESTGQQDPFTVEDLVKLCYS